MRACTTQETDEEEKERIRTEEKERIRKEEKERIRKEEKEHERKREMEASKKHTGPQEERSRRHPYIKKIVSSQPPDRPPLAAILVIKLNVVSPLIPRIY